MIYDDAERLEEAYRIDQDEQAEREAADDRWLAEKENQEIAEHGRASTWEPIEEGVAECTD